MSMYKVAVVGDKDSILGFKALGVATYPVTSTEEAQRAINTIVRDEVAIMFITEAVSEELETQLEELNRRQLPAVVLIPNNQGSLGLGMRQIKRNAEKAIGADILFGKEGN